MVLLSYMRAAQRLRAWIRLPSIGLCQATVGREDRKHDECCKKVKFLRTLGQTQSMKTEAGVDWIILWKFEIATEVWQAHSWFSDTYRSKFYCGLRKRLRKRGRVFLRRKMRDKAPPWVCPEIRVEWEVLASFLHWLLVQSLCWWNL